MKIVGGINPHSSSAGSIMEVVKKLNWLFYKENYTEFYKTVMEVARKYFSNNYSEFGYHNFVDTLYSNLKENLDTCERIENKFSDDGFYHFLTIERKKHLLLIQIKREYDMLKNQNDEDYTGIYKRRDRILKNIDKILKDYSLGTILFDFPLETEYDRDIKQAHSVLKEKFVPVLLKIKIELLIHGEKFEECLKIMDYILDTPESDDMQVDSQEILGAPSDNHEISGGLSLKPYLDETSLEEIDLKLSDVMMKSPKIVEYLLS